MPRQKLVGGGSSLQQCWLFILRSHERSVSQQVLTKKIGRHFYGLFFTEEGFKIKIQLPLFPSLRSSWIKFSCKVNECRVCILTIVNQEKKQKTKTKKKKKKKKNNNNKKKKKKKKKTCHYRQRNGTWSDVVGVSIFKSLKDHMSRVTRKPVLGVSDQLRLKLACSATEAS